MPKYLETIITTIKLWVRGLFEDTHHVLASHINELYDTKQDTISDLDAIRSGATLGSTALQSFTETDPTVPAWAKESTKPSYSVNEITGLQAALNAKSNTEHTHTVSEVTNAVASTDITTIVKITQSAYDALEVKDENTLYVIIPEITITFTIDGTSYTAIDGMTWAEWVDSTYNTDGYAVCETQGVNVISKDSGNHYVCPDGWYGTPVSQNEEINNGSYFNDNGPIDNNIPIDDNIPIEE